jgi:hypothetical protein
MERTRREILAVTRIGSPRVPRILAEGTVTIPTGENVVWLREQRIDGHSLRDVLKQRTLDRAELCRLGVQMLEAPPPASAFDRSSRREAQNIMVDAAGNLPRLRDRVTSDLSPDAIAAGGMAPPATPCWSSTVT